MSLNSHSSIISKKGSSPGWQASICSIEHGIAYLFHNSLYPDVTIRLNKNSGSFKDFKAHKLILSIWSSYFAEKFQNLNYMHEASIEDEPELLNLYFCNILAFENLLKFVYGCLDPKDIKDFDIAFETYKIATTFEILKLQGDCKKILDRALVTNDNVCQILEMACIVNSKPLKQRSLNIIEKETRQVLISNKFFAAPLHTVTTILEMQSMSLNSEYELIELIFAWAIKQCGVNFTMNDLRMIMDPILPLINFRALNFQQLALIFENYKGFFEDKEAMFLFMKTACPQTLFPKPEWYNCNIKPRKFTC